MIMMKSKSTPTSGLLMGRRERVAVGVRKGAWSQEEDLLLRKCVEKYGEGKWRQVPLKAGLNRCRKSCRLRWLNYLCPNIKRGEFTSDEVDLIVRMHKLLGNRWSLIAGRLPGRTANDIKNYCNTHLKKMLLSRVHHHHNKKDHHDDPLLKAAADHDYDYDYGDNKIMNVKPKAIKVLKPLPRTFSSRMKLFHKQQQLQHFDGSCGGSIDINSNRVSTNSTSPTTAAATTNSDAGDHEEKGSEEETSNLLLTSFGEELLNSFCGDGTNEGDMELMKNINMEHWDDCDLHLDDNLWRLLEIEREIIM